MMRLAQVGRGRSVLTAGYVDVQLIAPRMVTSMNIQMTNEQVSPLFCDKVSLTFKAESSQHKLIKTGIQELVADGYGFSVRRPRYRQSAAVDVAPTDGYEGQEMLLLQCDPAMTHAFFRCEFNPKRAHMPTVRMFIDRILAGGYESLVKAGACTRIDFTVDVYGAGIEKLLLWHAGYSKTSAHYKSGQIETYYLGSTTSPKQLCFYDKVAETKRRNKKRLIPEPLPPSPTTRFEVRIKDDQFLHELANVANPFQCLKVGSFDYPAFPNDEKFALFLEACRSRGAQDALLMLSESTRKKFRKALEESGCAWWDPTKVWEGWPVLFKHITGPGSKPQVN